MSKINIEEILKLVKEEMETVSTSAVQSIEREPREEPNDHEGRMARSEIRAMLVNGMKLYKLIGQNDELPGWVSAYITLAADYINSVTQYMIQDKVDDDE